MQVFQVFVTYKKLHHFTTHLKKIYMLLKIGSNLLHFTRFENPNLSTKNCAWWVLQNQKKKKHLVGLILFAHHFFFVRGKWPQLPQLPPSLKKMISPRFFQVKNVPTSPRLWVAHLVFAWRREICPRSLSIFNGCFSWINFQIWKHGSCACEKNQNFHVKTGWRGDDRENCWLISWGGLRCYWIYFLTHTCIWKELPFPKHHFFSYHVTFSVGAFHSTLLVGSHNPAIIFPIKGSSAGTTLHTEIAKCLAISLAKKQRKNSSPLCSRSHVCSMYAMTAMTVQRVPIKP